MLIAVRLKNLRSQRTYPEDELHQVQRLIELTDQQALLNPFVPPELAELSQYLSITARRLKERADLLDDMAASLSAASDQEDRLLTEAGCTISSCSE